MTSNFTPTLHRNGPGKGLRQTLYCHTQTVFSVLTLQCLKNLEGSFFTPSILSCQVTSLPGLLAP